MVEMKLSELIYLLDQVMMFEGDITLNCNLEMNKGLSVKGTFTVNPEGVSNLLKLFEE